MPPSTKQLVLGRGLAIDILQPEAIDENFTLKIKSYQPDFFVVTAYAKILPKELIEIPRLGALGVHPSLLPKYRGTTPIQSVILRGEKETGVSVYLLDPKVDHGLILAGETCPISDTDTYETLSGKLADLGGDLLVRTLPSFLAGKISPMVQDERAATLTKKFSADAGFVSGTDLREAIEQGGEKALRISRMVRAMNPEPGVWTNELAPYAPKRVKILAARVSGANLVLQIVQVEGEKPRHLESSK